VHWGATSQDVADTALILLLKKTVVILEADLLRLEDALQALIAKHRKTMMAGLTLLQSAPREFKRNPDHHSNQQIDPVSEQPLPKGCQ